MDERKKGRIVAFGKAYTNNYLVRVEWFAVEETVQKFYEFSSKKKAEEFMKGLRAEFTAPAIRLYREVLSTSEAN